MTAFHVMFTASQAALNTEVTIFPRQQRVTTVSTPRTDALMPLYVSESLSFGELESVFL